MNSRHLVRRSSAHLDGELASFAIDAGGSRTVARVQRQDGREMVFERSSCAIATVGAARAAETLSELLARVREGLGTDSPSVLGVIASSAMPFLNEAEPPRVLVDVITRAGLPGSTILVNDLVPLLWSAHVAGSGLVISSGTGSSVIGRTADGRLLKVGGHEYVLSDEGSAYALGRRALTAAARAVDGTGPSTRLVAYAVETYGMPLPALGRLLAEATDRRCQVARFAPRVVDAYDFGDHEATRIVVSETAALARAAAAAIDRLGLPADTRVGLAGGVLRNSAVFRDVFGASLKAAGLTGELAVLDNLAAATDYADLLDTDGTDELVHSVGGLEFGPRELR